MISAYIRYTVDSDKLDHFEDYGRRWIGLVQRFGGRHHGYFLPHESASDLAVALFSFPSLAAYETYRAQSRSDEACRAAYALARESGCILRYDRQFLRPILASDPR